ncbi:MAG TPA: ABC transporter permease, partial [Anaerolineae bacterium]|nr:ABC transporter permease [Anaerolineae bacterium]
MIGQTFVDILIHLDRHRARTLLTTSGLVVGIFVLVLVGSVSETLNTVFSEQAEATGNTLRVYTNRWDVRLSPAVRHEVRRVQGVAGTLVTLWGELADPEEDEPPSFQFEPEKLQAVDSDIPGLEYGPPVVAQPLLRGRLPLPGATNELLTDFDLAQARGWQVGQNVAVRGRPFVIVGILERPALAGSRTAYLDYETLRALLRIPTTDLRVLEVVPEAGQDPVALARRIEQAVPGTMTLTAAEQAGDRQGMLALSAIAGLSGALALLAGALTVANTMLMSVQERRAEIGLKKALGATDGDVVREFVLEAGVLGGLAGGVGLLLAWFLILGANAFLRSQWGLALLTLTPRLAAAALVLPTAVATTAGAYPAWRAARQDPVQALRGIQSAAEGDAGRGFKPMVRRVARRARWFLTIGGISAAVLILTVTLSLAEFMNFYITSAVDATYDRVGLYPKRPTAFGTAVRELERLNGVRGVV